MSKKNIIMELLRRKDAEPLSGLVAKSKGPTGVISKYNQSQTQTATINNCIYALGMLLQGNVKVVYNDNTDEAYVEITYAPNNVVKGVVSHKGILTGSETLTLEHMVDMLSVFAFCEYNEELAELLKKVKLDYINGGMITLINALKICDNVYFNVFNKQLEDCFDYSQRKTLEEEVKQGIRSGSFTEPLMLKDFNCADISLKVEMYKASETESESAIPDDALAVLDMCKRGEFRINFNWGENAKYIPSLSVLDTFVPTQHFIPLIRKIDKKLKRVLTRMDMGKTGREAIGHDFINVEFTGRPGTGKTTLAEVLAATFGMPIYISKNSDDVEDDEYEGKTKPIDGKFDFVETSFLKGFTSGGFIVDEEYNLTKAGIKMGAVGQAIEAPFILKRNGYEDVTRHPLTIYVATSNVNTEGTKDVSQPFSTRSKNAYVIEDPDDATFIKILKAWDSEYKTNDCKRVLNVYKQIISFLCSNKVEAPEIALKISIRQCMGALDTLYEGNSFKYAIETSMIGKIHQSDESIADTVRKTILTNLRD